MSRTFSFGLLIMLMAGFFTRCASEHSRQEVIAGMSSYDLALVSMDMDSIAEKFTLDGELGDMAKGRDSIRNFLKRFASYRVLSNRSVTDDVSVFGDTAISRGTYAQVTMLPSRDTVRVKGSFVAKWIWRGQEGWKIRRMDTKPAQ